MKGGGFFSMFWYSRVSYIGLAFATGITLNWVFFLVPHSFESGLCRHVPGCLARDSPEVEGSADSLRNQVEEAREAMAGEKDQRKEPRGPMGQLGYL